MSTNKKYYWLKLKDNFFDSEEMILLESKKNGVHYQNLYLKMCLLSLKNDGCVAFKNHIPYDIGMLSVLLRTNEDVVKEGLRCLKDLDLIEILDSGIIFMSEIESLIGKGSSEAERHVAYREKIKRLKLLEQENAQAQGGGASEGQGARSSQNRAPEKEKEIEIEIEKETHTPVQKKESIKNPILFDKFWLLYNKKTGKANTIKEWNKIPEDKYPLIIDSLTNYLKDRPDSKFRKDPERYLKHKVYEDEAFNDSAAPEFMDYS